MVAVPLHWERHLAVAGAAREGRERGTKDIEAVRTDLTGTLLSVDQLEEAEEDNTDWARQTPAYRAAEQQLEEEQQRRWAASGLQATTMHREISRPLESVEIYLLHLLRLLESVVGWRWLRGGIHGVAGLSGRLRGSVRIYEGNAT